MVQFLREHRLMRAMGWTRAQMLSHSPFELELHQAVLDHEQKQYDAESFSMEHKIAQIGGKW